MRVTRQCSVRSRWCISAECVPGKFGERTRRDGVAINSYRRWIRAAAQSVGDPVGRFRTRFGIMTRRTRKLPSFHGFAAGKCDVKVLYRNKPRASFNPTNRVAVRSNGFFFPHVNGGRRQKTRLLNFASESVVVSLKLVDPRHSSRRFFVRSTDWNERLDDKPA